MRMARPPRQPDYLHDDQSLERVSSAMPNHQGSKDGTHTGACVCSEQGTTIAGCFRAFARDLLLQRWWEREHIPLYSPQISFDLLLFIADVENSKTQPKAKDIHLAVGFSQDRVRDVLKTLKSTNWIEFQTDPKDARVRRVRLSEKGRRLLDECRNQYIKRGLYECRHAAS